jgi:gamma-glutamyltranspeptidase/glutathione hydrolase
VKEFPELQRVYGKEGNAAWKAGDRLIQKDLGKTLRLIAEQGPTAFYQGAIADQLVAEMKAGGGLITKKDLADYRAVIRQPIHGTYRGYDVYAPPPPSSGGICLVEMLNILETFDLKKQGRYSVATLHQTTEAMRRAYCDRARYLGDADFVKIPAHLTSKEYARKLAASIDPGKATRSEDLAGDIPLTDEKESTTHFSIIDKDGMAVSNTYTLEASFGCRVVVRGAGFLLNNEMDDFNPRPGVTTRAGKIGTEPNLIAPGKRMLSSMTPTIVTRDGQVVLITGSPGGRTIINTVLRVVLDVLEFEVPLRQAVDSPRWHHAWFPDRIQAEAGLLKEYPAELKKLEALGHRLAPRPAAQGDAHSIAIDPRTGVYRGEADKRRGGAAAGY